mmetsp:Transcript_16661/g.43168  ORF Transcript_16661/g.43168 Transcript_16661/m.43168 type:complete len:260 (+) Transcript_16661:1-780(+)
MVWSPRGLPPRRTPSFGTWAGRPRGLQTMPIIYSLVARGTCVLAEHTTTSGNFTTVTRRILEKIPRDAESKMSYVYDRHVFHYAVQDGLVFLCMADEDFGRRVPFAFIDDVKTRWFNTYGDRGASALAYGMNEDFSRVLGRQMDYHSHDTEVDAIARVRGEIDEVKEVMVANIERVLERGEKIELLVDKTDNLNQQAFRFKKQSTYLRRALWWKNCKLAMLIFAVVSAIVLFIVMSACGVTFHKCTSRGGPPKHGSKLL